MTHLFGPVNSRRLGLSLGVDLIPRKTCPFDCIYCEVGPTTRCTLTRLDYRPEEILTELKEYFAGHPAPDFITLAGSGEPTLNLGLGRIIAGIKRLTNAPVAVLTNGTLLHLPEVRRDLAAADVVLPSLDAATEETFQTINRPHSGLSLDLLLSGLKALRQNFPGQIWLEVMILKGFNDSETELAALKRAIGVISPDRVQLNTAVRPGVEDYARPLNQDEMEAVAVYLGGGAEVIAASQSAATSASPCDDAVLVEMLARRPMTAADVARALGLPLAWVRQRLLYLCATGRLAGQAHCDQEFYRHVSEA